jgi:septum formation inhibitor MinC
MTKFDPIAVGDQIADHLSKADSAKASQLEHSTAAGALLLDVQKNHPKHLESICERIGLGHSRRGELLMIASGRRTQEENKRISKARQDKKRAKDRDAKAKALPPPKPEPPESVTPVVTDSPEASAARRKAEYAAMEAAAEVQPVDVAAPKSQPAPAEPVALPKSKVTPSGQALAEFKVAADCWISKMSKRDSHEAILYAMAIYNRLYGRRMAA